MWIQVYAGQTVQQISIGTRDPAYFEIARQWHMIWL
jgi:hypothetical protein